MKIKAGEKYRERMNYLFIIYYGILSSFLFD